MGPLDAFNGAKRCGDDLGNAYYGLILADKDDASQN